MHTNIHPTLQIMFFVISITFLVLYLLAQVRHKLVGARALIQVLMHHLFAAMHLRSHAMSVSLQCQLEDPQFPHLQENCLSAAVYHLQPHFTEEGAQLTVSNPLSPPLSGGH